MTDGKCPDCGSPVTEGEPCCSHCGAPLSWEGVEEIPQLPLSNEAILLPDGEWELVDAKVREYGKAMDFRFFYAREWHDAIIFTFIRQGEYVMTRDDFLYIRGCGNSTGVFSRGVQHHDHVRLTRNPRFRSMIENSGMEFLRCHGGYVTQHSSRPDEYRLIDRIDVRAVFNDGGDVRVFDIDLEKMELGGQRCRELTQ